MEYRGEKASINGSLEAKPRRGLLDEVRARLRLKHYSSRTETAYVAWIRRYIRACGMRHPRDMDGKAVEGF